MLSQFNTVRGFLVTVGLDPEILVQFQFNPQKLSDKRAVTYATLNAPGQLLPTRQYTQGGDRTLSFSIELDGRSLEPVPLLLDPDGGITPELNKYRAFLYPRTNRWLEARGTFIPLFEEQQQFVSPPTCIFGFGERLIRCIVTDVSITETLFNARLAPLRAELSITLVELLPYDGSDLSLPGGF